MIKKAWNTWSSKESSYQRPLTTMLGLKKFCFEMFFTNQIKRKDKKTDSISGVVKFECLCRICKEVGFLVTKVRNNDLMFNELSSRFRNSTSFNKGKFICHMCVGLLIILIFWYSPILITSEYCWFGNCSQGLL